MEVRVGIKHSARELSFETEEAPSDVRKSIEKAIANDDEILVLTDSKGRQFLINTDAITYVELGTETGRRVGFIS